VKEAFERRPFFRNVTIMFGGAASGQVISVLLAPVLTRLYSPEQFGVLSVYLAVLTILVVIASLRYELTLPLVKNATDEINLVAVCGCALVVTTAALTLVVFLVPWEASGVFGTLTATSSQLLSYRGLLPVGFFCLGAYYIALYMATRAEAFRLIAISRISQGVIGPTSQIALAAIGTPGILIGSILGQSAGTFGLMYRLMAARLPLLREITWRRMAHLARRYYRFPVLGGWTALLEAAGGSQLLYLLIWIQYSGEIAGYIFLVERVVVRPLSIIGTSILQVFVGEAGRLISTEPEKFGARFRQVVLYQFYFAAGWIVVANVAGLAFFSLVFGENWSTAVVYLQALSIGYLAQTTIQPVFHTLQLLERQTLAAVWEVGRLILTFAAFSLGTYYQLEPPKVVFVYSLAQAVSCAALLWLMTKSVRRLQREGQ